MVAKERLEGKGASAHSPTELGKNHKLPPVIKITMKGKLEKLFAPHVV